MKDILSVLLIPVVIIIFFLLLIGCGTYTKPPIASHVLAVTLQGDTILVAIDKIRPNQYQFYYPLYSQPYYRPYYYNRYDYQWRYNDNRGVSSSRGISSSGNSNNNTVKAKVTPDITVRPPSEVLMKVKK
tara:strand:- start:768 stop:1157 length:390 start_codon:yes stop_codon:yes gene_type:complete